MTSLHPHAPTFNPTTLAAPRPAPSNPPADLAGLPPYHAVMATIFYADPDQLNPVSRLALAAWSAAVERATRSLLSIDERRAAGYEAAAKVLGACWAEEREREMVAAAIDFVMADDPEPQPITDGYFVATEPEPVVGLPAGPRPGQYNVRRGPVELTAEDYEVAEVRGWVGGHEA